MWWLRWECKPDEINGIVNDFNEPGSLAPTGLFLSGAKYMVIKGEARAVILGNKCQGSGVKTVIRQLGLGYMIQPRRYICHECKGSGVLISETDKSPSCKGNKVTKEKVLEVHVEKG